MFPLPVQGRGGSKNKKHLSILAHSPNPVLHTSTSELSPLFSPAEFLDLLRRPDDGGSGRGPSTFSSSPYHIAGTGPRLSPFGSSEPSPLHFSPGPSPADDEGPFRFSLEVDAAGHASLLPLQLPERVPPSVCVGGLSGHGEGQPRLLSPLYLGGFPGPPRVANTASSPTSPLSAAFSPASSSDSSLASQPPWQISAGPPSSFFPPGDARGPLVGPHSHICETQSDTASPVPLALPARRPPLVSHNSAPTVPIVNVRPPPAESPRVRDAATLKPQRSTSSLRLSSMSGMIKPELSSLSPKAGLPVSDLASLLPIVPRKDIASTTKKNHALTRSANYTPRPPNSWILYRSETIKQMRLAKERGETYPIPEAVKNHPDIANSDGTMPQADISKMVAVMWKLEGKEVKLQYEQLSAIRKLEHAEMFPDYKFQPTRKTPTTTPSASTATVKPPPKAKAPRKAAPPLVQYPKTTPRAPLPKSSKMQASTSTQSAPAGDSKTTGKKKTLKRTKKSRSNLSSRGPSPEKAAETGQHSPSSWPYPAPVASPRSWPASVEPTEIPAWTVPGPANAHAYGQVSPQPLMTPTEYPHPYPVFEAPLSHQTWANARSPTVYYPAYPSTPPETATGTPQGHYSHPAPFNAFAADMTDYDFASPVGRVASYEAPAHFGYRSQLSPAMPPPAPRASFDGIAYTQIISDAYVDPAYHHGAGSIEVAGRPAEVFAGPTAESSLAATWSLLEEDDAPEPTQSEASPLNSSGTSWTSSQGDWVIEPPFQQRWPAQGP